MSAIQYTGQVTLVTNDPTGSNPVVQLTGWGGGPQITCRPTYLDFGGIEAFTTKWLPVICTNTGTAVPSPFSSLTIDPPTASPGFNAVFDSSKDVYPLNGLAPGQRTQIDVSYYPTSSTVDDGRAVLHTSGGHRQDVVIPLSGRGLPLGQCQFEVSPTAIDFGDVAVGDTSAAITFEIQKRWGRPLRD